MRFENKTVIVTGAARGIGKGIALAFAREGANLIVADIDDGDAKKSAEELDKLGATSISIRTDVSSSRDVKQLVDKTVQQFGRIDVLVNNAGIGKPVTIDKLTEDEWDRTLAVNLKGVFLCSKAVMDIMRRQKYGRIINIASLAGKIGGVFIGADYSASKAGVISLTKSFAKHLGKFGITVNAVSPGTVMTSMMDYWPKKTLNKILKSVVIGRFGLPDDIAQAVLFLSSESAGWITGEILDVDGGESAFYQLER